MPNAWAQRSLEPSRLPKEPKPRLPGIGEVRIALEGGCQPELNGVDRFSGQAGCLRSRTSPSILRTAFLEMPIPSTPTPMPGDDEGKRQNDGHARRDAGLSQTDLSQLLTSSAAPSIIRAIPGKN